MKLNKIFSSILALFALSSLCHALTIISSDHPIAIAIQWGDLKTLENLPIEPDMEVFTNPWPGSVPLALFAVRENLHTQWGCAVLKDLAHKGVNLHARDQNNLSALHIAIRGGDQPLFEFLVEQNLDIYVEDTAGTTLLHYAVYNGNMPALEFLIDHHLDIFSRDTNGRTPLHAATMSRNTDAVIALLNAGADPMAKDKHDTTPLCYAAQLGDTDSVEAFINFQFVPDHPDATR